MTRSFALALAALALASCSVGDAICTDKTVEEDRNDDCPYGPPGGPQRQQAERCEITFDDTNCTKTWRDDVFPILVRAYAGQDSGGGCTLQACHGPNGTGRGDLVLPESPTPDELYAALEAKTNDAGDPYLEAGNDHAYFLCNLEAKIGGGSAMPPNAGLTDSPSTPTDDNDLATIEEWVRCGMELDGSGTGGGGGGVGGAGGGP
ncbi:MAG: hypothetical protein U0271_27545 [Polyangiaceae bacterium]